MPPERDAGGQPCRRLRNSFGLWYLGVSILGHARGVVGPGKVLVYLMDMGFFILGLRTDLLLHIVSPLNLPMGLCYSIIEISVSHLGLCVLCVLGLLFS